MSMASLTAVPAWKPAWKAMWGCSSGIGRPFRVESVAVPAVVLFDIVRVVAGHVAGWACDVGFGESPGSHGLYRREEDDGHLNDRGKDKWCEEFPGRHLSSASTFLSRL